MMKKIVAVSLLSICMVSAIGGCTNPTPKTFGDWCRNKNRLTPEARQMVEVLLEQTGTQECDLAEEKLVNSTVLYLGGNEIVDVAPLASLTNLTRLDLGGNKIVEVAPLASLTNLTVLYLGGNEIVEVAPLASLTNLTVLDLSRNEIVDAVPLGSLTNLTGLQLDGNPLRDRVCPVQPETICRF
ncbi:MAG: leucine-rich repeat domain-containing protein [Spirulina sp.]